jgi:hypothetical protein
VFDLGSRAFLHFHDDASGVFADVRLAEGFARLPVTTPSQQADLLDRIDDCLAAVEARERGRRRNEPPRTDCRQGRAARRRSRRGDGDAG